MTAFSAVEVIRAKRDGERVPDEALRWFIDAYTHGHVADEQAAAFCMATFWRGMEPDELATWTAAMIASGERLDLSSVTRPTVDKHSTGGVGDKISLVLCPLVAALGAAVPQLSGRGLGHTGGTLDKMEAIPGWRAQLSNDEAIAQLRDIGVVICAAGAGLAPADRKLYALRDVTSTVESIPLIASSIMSKKIAEGTSALVLDVKVGSGAFMKDEARARELAETMVRLGEAHGVRTTALLTRMQTPLGRTAGNALEVTESVETLQGRGPADVTDLTVALAEEMLALVGLPHDTATVTAALHDGRALASWNAMVRAQGGDPSAELPGAAASYELVAGDGGILTTLDALAVGVAAWRLGAGRARKEDPVSFGAGIELLVREGEAVEKGQPLMRLHTDDPQRFGPALDAVRPGIAIGPEPGETLPIVIDRIRA